MSIRGADSDRDSNAAADRADPATLTPRIAEPRLTNRRPGQN